MFHKMPAYNSDFENNVCLVFVLVFFGGGVGVGGELSDRWK